MTIAFCCFGICQEQHGAQAYWLCYETGMYFDLGRIVVAHEQHVDGWSGFFTGGWVGFFPAKMFQECAIFCCNWIPETGAPSLLHFIYQRGRGASAGPTVSVF
jgi:hypothetical protein